MTVERRAAAPRLIEWTGERCVPWAPDVQVVYEHYHRYLWAERLVKGRRVLDVGSGEGFGSAILAGSAESVCGIDIDEKTIAHAQLNYSAPNLEFRVGSALDLSGFETGSLGAVVCFEVIEHVREQEQVIAEIRRVLADDGLLLLSTPDRRAYSDATDQKNPFHERELTREELEELLAGFEHTRIWGQHVVTGSHLAAGEREPGGESATFYLDRTGDSWRVATELAPVYMIAASSSAPFTEPAGDSFLADPGIELVRAVERDLARERGVAAAARAEADDARAQADRADGESADARAQAKIAQHELAAVRDRAQAAIRERDALRHERDASAVAHADVRSHLALAKTQREQAREEAARHQAEAAQLVARLRRVDESVTWRVFQAVRRRLYGRLGERSLAGRAVQRSLRAAGRLAFGRVARGVAAAEPTRALPEPIALPEFQRPEVSIVIPVHSQADLTAACLRSIARLTSWPPFEVILVDDHADAETRDLWRVLTGARVLVNDENLGFLRSVNRGAAEARGRHLVLLNNDTEVQEGWLEALVARAESAPDVGVVAAKLLYPDGSLQEAGAIVFSDGSGWNFGRGGDPGRPEYNYAREVDYGSGACLLVRKELFDSLGGFDERFTPAYYEDTDLCFAARANGYRVMYEPTARVVHVEGASSGTDVSSGVKRHQDLNHPKFVAKWRDRLASDHHPRSEAIVRHASARSEGPHVLVIDHMVPMPDRDSGSLRMSRLLESLIDIGCRVTFLPDDAAAHQPYTARLQAQGIEVLYGAVDVRAEIAAIGPRLRLAIASRPYVAARCLHMLRELAPAARVIYDTVDLHYVREERRAALAGEPNSPLSVSLKELELALVRGTDTTAVVTEEERERLLVDVPTAQVVVIPNVHEPAADVPGPAGRQGLLFVGGFAHPPNTDAAVTLVRSVMPIVWRELGEVPVRIVGADPPPEVQALGSPLTEVTGWVEDLDPLLQSSRAMVAPLRFGAGMKGKVTQSLAAGLPVVTTPVGAEGLLASDDQTFLVGQEPADIAEHVIRLYRDDALWTQLSAAGRELVVKTCSPAIMRRQLRDLVASSAPDTARVSSARTHAAG